MTNVLTKLIKLAQKFNRFLDALKKTKAKAKFMTGIKKKLLTIKERLEMSNLDTAIQTHSKKGLEFMKNLLRASQLNPKYQTLKTHPQFINNKEIKGHLNRLPVNKSRDLLLKTEGNRQGQEVTSPLSRKTIPVNTK